MAAFRRRNLLATVAAAAAAAVSVLVASPGVVAQAPQPRTGISRNNAVFAGRKGDVDRIINGRIVTKDDEDYGAHLYVGRRGIDARDLGRAVLFLRGGEGAEELSVSTVSRLGRRVLGH